MNNVMNQSVNVTERARFVNNIPRSILDNLRVLQQYRWNTIKI